MNLDILEYCLKWHSLGVETYLCKIDGIYGIKKLHKNPIKFDPLIHETKKQIPRDYNFLGISLKNSGIMCLDVEGTKGSVNAFVKILQDNSLKIEDFLVETTLHNGYHLYFKTPKNINYKNIYGLKIGDLQYDLLFTGKAFSSPSSYNNIEYRFINKSVLDINSLDDIQDLPDCLFFLLNNRDK